MPAPNHVPTAAIELDQPRMLRMDFKALLLAEELTGRDFSTEEAWQKLGLKGTAALVYGCLKHEDADLTFDRVLGLLHPGNASYVTERMKALFQEAFGEDAPKDGEGAAPAGPFPEGSGGSGPSPASTSA